MHRTEISVLTGDVVMVELSTAEIEDAQIRTANELAARAAEKSPTQKLVDFLNANPDVAAMVS